VSDVSALLLRDIDKVRFVPAANWNGTATLTYRAWDQSSGTAGSTASATSNGGATSFSAAVQTANLTVTPVNDAPVLAAGTPSLTPILPGSSNPAGNLVSSFAGSSITDVDTGALKGIAVTAVTGTGTWQYYNGTIWVAFGTVSTTSALLLDGNTLV